MKTITVSVINDLATDQRVGRTCLLLHEIGFKVELIGRILPNSLPLNRPYMFKRFKMRINKGPLFYLFFNIRLFFYLLFKKIDVFYSNDLDTLLANTLVSIIKRKPLIYDSHEFFTGVPEVQNRKIVRYCWRLVEKFCFRFINSFITVNQSISNLYSELYKSKIEVIRNVSLPYNMDVLPSRAELGLPLDKFILIMQGAGINVDRGYEEAVISMKEIDNAILLIIGSGDVIETLKMMVKTYDLNEKVHFIGKLPYNEMMKYTFVSDLGLTLDKSSNINYQFSLPNKLFDYIQAGLPVLASDLIEVKQIVFKYDIGKIINEVSSEKISQAVRLLMSDDVLLDKYRRNSLIASQTLNWDVEKEKLQNIMLHYV